MIWQKVRVPVFRQSYATVASCTLLNGYPRARIFRDERSTVRPFGSVGLCLLFYLLGSAVAQGSSTPPQVKTVNGVIEGEVTATEIQFYRGIPSAAPPIGELRWKAPQPVQSWTETRSAKRFGASCMQRPIYGDM